MKSRGDEKGWNNILFPCSPVLLHLGPHSPRVGYVAGLFSSMRPAFYPYPYLFDSGGPESGCVHDCHPRGKSPRHLLFRSTYGSQADLYLLWQQTISPAHGAHARRSQQERAIGDLLFAVLLVTPSRGGAYKQHLLSPKEACNWGPQIDVNPQRWYF